MSNPSLKEQLQALSLESSVSSKKASKPNAAKPAATKSKPAWLEQAQYGVELLKVHFPECFKEIKDIKPLKIGIKQDLIKNLSSREDIVISDKACMVNSLSYYVNSIAYHKNVIAGAQRVDLQGEPSGVITAEEAQYSLECRKTKLQKKKSTSPEKKTVEQIK